MLQELPKKSLDSLWDKLNALEEAGKAKGKEATEIRHRLELNARLVVWNKRGIKVLDGGKAKAA